jgi:serine/threonine protein phosphatase PrpC
MGISFQTSSNINTLPLPAAPAAADNNSALPFPARSLQAVLERSLKHRTWQPRRLPSDIAMQKMWNNAKKAIEEHTQRATPGYAVLNDALPSLEKLANQRALEPLRLTHVSADAQGVRHSMEDAHFFKEIEQGALTGVFDGHGGAEVAKAANELFQRDFSTILQNCEGNVHQAFEQLIQQIQAKVASDDVLRWMGSTAVVCFIDKQTQRIYTATLGDSEANLYRKIDNQLQSIPLSCVRDWSSQKDADRAAVALNDPDIAEIWPQIPNPKMLRFPNPFYGVNVSRSFGDLKWNERRPQNSPPAEKDKPGVFYKPKITVNQLQPGDLLVLACDGLKDYVPEEEICAQIQAAGDQNVAERLVDYALNVRLSRDNVTVLAVAVQ